MQGARCHSLQGSATSHLYLRKKDNKCTSKGTVTTLACRTELVQAGHSSELVIQSVESLLSHL